MKGTQHTITALILIISTLLIAGCNSKSDNVSDRISIGTSENDSIITPVVLDIDITKAQPFENRFSTTGQLIVNENDEHFLGRPESIVICGDTIFAVDGFYDPGFYAYSHNGTKLFHYCSTGGGPEDVNQPRYLNVSDSTISAFASAPPSLVVIDRHGKFVKRIELPFTACGAMFDPVEGYWVNYSNQDYEDVKLAWYPDSVSQPVVALTVPQHLKGMTTSSTGTFQNLGDGTINYIDLYEPRIYSLRQGKCHVKYELDFNGLWPDEGMIKSRYGGDSWANKSRDFPIFGLAAIEGNRWVAITFMHKGSKYVYLYDKTKDTGSTYTDIEDSYSYPKYISDSLLYIPRKDDAIEILNLSTSN